MEYLYLSIAVVFGIMLILGSNQDWSKDAPLSSVARDTKK